MKLFITCTLTTLLTVGCASTNPANPQDPYEKLNRKVYAFNMAVDKVVTKPIAKVYDKVMPKPLNTGVSNFFDNLSLVPTIGNDILQGNLTYTLNDLWRFMVNSTLGIGGLFDVGTHIGLEEHHTDLGITFAKWGWQNSNYIVLPILGPSTMRDAVSYPGNIYMSPWPYIDPESVRYGLYALDLVDTRAQLLPADKLIEQAFDPYVFLRSAYLQLRQNKLHQAIHGEEKPLVKFNNGQ